MRPDGQRTVWMLAALGIRTWGAPRRRLLQQSSTTHSQGLLLQLLLSWRGHELDHSVNPGCCSTPPPRGCSRRCSWVLMWGCCQVRVWGYCRGAAVLLPLVLSQAQGRMIQGTAAGWHRLPPPSPPSPLPLLVVRRELKRHQHHMHTHQRLHPHMLLCPPPRTHQQLHPRKLLRPPLHTHQQLHPHLRLRPHTRTHQHLPITCTLVQHMPPPAQRVQHMWQAQLLSHNLPTA